VRLFNTVGPRQTGSYGMVIPRFVGQAVRGEPITVFGDGSQTRCFCYVGDVVRALAELIDHPEAYGRVFNIGGTEEISMLDLADRIVDLAGSSSKVRLVSYEDAYEEGFEDMQRRVPDIGRVQALIGFQPTAGLDDILKMVVEEQRA
jgi:UDP-glucose 4-epimerase